MGRQPSLLSPTAPSTAAIATSSLVCCGPRAPARFTAFVEAEVVRLVDGLAPV